LWTNIIYKKVNQKGSGASF